MIVILWYNIIGANNIIMMMIEVSSAVIDAVSLAVEGLPLKN